MPATNKHIERAAADTFLDLILRKLCQADSQKLLLLSGYLAAASGKDLDLVTELLNDEKNLKSIKELINLYKLLSHLLGSAAKAAVSRAEALEKLYEHRLAPINPEL